MASWPDDSPHDQELGRPPRIGRGTVLGSFRIVGRLGAGGMGEVYRAEHVYVPDRPAAIKVLKPERARKGDFEQRFHSEASKLANLSKLKHPNIVEFIDANIQGGVAWIAMELLSGSSFDELLLTVGRFSIPDTLLLLGEALDGLNVAHLCGLIHRDLKPGNLFLTKDGVTKLLDFGTAKLVKARPTLRKLQPTTEKNVVHGTWRYMSPEQILGEPPLDHTSDLFTMAIIAYEMLSGGRHPFEGESELEDRRALGFRAILNEPVPLLRYLPDCPEELWTLLSSMLRKNPKERPASAAKAAEKMREICTEYLASRGLPRPSLSDLFAAQSHALAPTEPESRDEERADAAQAEAPTTPNPRPTRAHGNAPPIFSPPATRAPVDVRLLNGTIEMPPDDDPIEAAVAPLRRATEPTAPLPRPLRAAATPSPVVVAPVKTRAVTPIVRHASPGPRPAEKARVGSASPRWSPRLALPGAIALVALVTALGVWTGLRRGPHAPAALPESVPIEPTPTGATDATVRAPSVAFPSAATASAEVSPLASVTATASAAAPPGTAVASARPRPATKPKPKYDVYDGLGDAPKPAKPAASTTSAAKAPPARPFGTYQVPFPDFND